MNFLPLLSARPECKSADAKKLFYIHLNTVVLNFTEFKKILKFMNFTNFN